MASYTHISKLVPSSITIMSLCFGMFSIKMSMSGRWGAAIVCILVAGLLDMLDGAVARILRADSVFGAQLDSLCDILNFGLCPAIALYMWGLRGVKVSGWLLVTLYVICMALRLARFNASSIQSSSLVLNPQQRLVKNMFFTGVPAPAGAMLLVVPIMLSVSLTGMYDQRLHPMQMQIYTFIVALLLVSPIPTFSLKTLQIDRKVLPVLTILFVLCIMCSVIKPWIVLPVLCVAYVLSIPCSALLSVYIKSNMKS